MVVRYFITKKYKTRCPNIFLVSTEIYTPLTINDILHIYIFLSLSFFLSHEIFISFIIGLVIIPQRNTTYEKL